MHFLKVCAVIEVMVDGGPGEPDIKGNGVGLNEKPRPTVLQLPVERVGVLLWVVAARFDEETILQFAPVH